jgi:hypothetical protein
LLAQPKNALITPPHPNLETIANNISTRSRHFQAMEIVSAPAPAPSRTRSIENTTANNYSCICQAQNFLIFSSILQALLAQPQSKCLLLLLKTLRTSQRSNVDKTGPADEVMKNNLNRVEVCVNNLKCETSSF